MDRSFLRWCVSDRDHLLAQLPHLTRSVVATPALALETVLDLMGCEPQLPGELQPVERLGLPELYQRNTLLALELGRQQCGSDQPKKVWAYAAVFCLPEEPLKSHSDLLWLMEDGLPQSAVWERISALGKHFQVDHKLALTRLIHLRVLGLNGHHLVPTQAPQFVETRGAAAYRSPSADPFGFR